MISDILKIGLAGLAGYAIKKWYDSAQEHYGTDGVCETAEKMAEEAKEYIKILAAQVAEKMQS